MACRLFLLLFLLLYGQYARAWKPFVRDIYLNDAGTSVRVHDIAIDRQQYMWLATDEGLYRYNGRTFTLLPDSTNSFVTALAIAGNGLWVGYSNGTLAWCDGQDIFPSRIAAANDQESVSDLLYAPWGLVWSTQGNGIYLHFFTGYTAHLNKENGLIDDFVYDLEWDAGSSGLLAATDQEMVRVQPGRGGKLSIEALTHTPADKNFDKISRCLAVAPLPGGRTALLRGSQEGGLWGLLCNASGKISDSKQVSGTAPFGQINDVDAAPGNHFWAATEDGCLLRAKLAPSEGTVFQLTDTIRLPGRKLYKVITDRAGTVWVATSQGLTSLTINYLEYLPLHTHFDHRSAFALATDMADHVWYTQNEALYSVHGSGPVLRYTAPATITALFPDSAGRMWIGTLGKGLIAFDTQGHALPVRNIPSLADGHILSITGSGRKLWISSLNGVDELETTPGPALKLVQHHSKRSGIGSDYVYRLYTDRAGRTWMATDGGGISMYDGNRYHHWDSTAGFKSKVVYTVTEDARGQIWAGTLEDGLYRYDGHRWYPMNHREGLHDLKISAVAGNATGQVVVVNQGGVDVWLPSSHTFRSFNRRSGIDVDTVSHVLNCITTDRSGAVLTLFEQGLLRIRNMEHNTDIKPSVVLTGVILFSNDQPLSRHCYASNENYLSFRFEGITAANPEKLHYRYLLEGHNNQWVSTSDESASFPQLRPGKYLFRVQASLHDSFDEAATATYAFTITTPLWRRPWFIGVAALALLFLVYGYIRLRERNLRKLSLLQRERMMFEYEHLKSQVNPHFLFNSLNTLVNLIEEDHKTAVDYTVQLSDLYRNMLAHRDRDLIRLSEEWDILEKYLYIQQSRFGSALQLKTNVTEELKRNSRIVPLALQLLVENAIKHNIVSRSRPLVISILADGENLIVSNTLQEKTQKEKGAGLGLTNIRNRYALITRRPVTFGPRDGSFIVTLPLL